MAESFLVGASLINIFIGVWLVNARLFPMAISMFPLLKSKKQPLTPESPGRRGVEASSLGPSVELGIELASSIEFGIEPRLASSLERPRGAYGIER